MGCNTSKDIQSEEKKEETKDDRQDHVETKQADHISTPNEEMAATKIQATFRGYKARKEVEKMKKGTSSQKTSDHKLSNFDPNDPVLSNAATKIQASFRGHRVREELKAQKELKKTEDRTELSTL